MVPVLAGFSTWFAASLPWRSMSRTGSKVQIKTTKVSGNIYMLEGQGAHCRFGGRGRHRHCGRPVCSVAEKIQAALKEMKLRKALRFVIKRTITETTRRNVRSQRRLHAHRPG